MNDEQFEPESARVVRQLREEIIDGIRPPGSRLVERELASELGVSRLPIRDALQRLAVEGLVTLRPRSWSIVRDFTSRDIAELQDVRSALEVLAFRLAAGRRSAQGLARLRADLDREFAAAHAGDAILARRAAADFHESVVVIADNRLLSEIELLLRSRLRWLFVQHDDLLAVAEAHGELYRAIENGDPELAEKLAVAHVHAGDAEEIWLRLRKRTGRDGISSSPGNCS